jgi:hypothetical protein
MDPWGHLAPWTFKDIMTQDNGSSQWKLFCAQTSQCAVINVLTVDIRPTIAITKAHMKVRPPNPRAFVILIVFEPPKLPELEDSVKSGRLYVVCHLRVLAIFLQSHSTADGKVCLNDQGELAVTKFAVEPVSHYASNLFITTLTLKMAGLVSARCCRTVWDRYVMAELFHHTPTDNLKTKVLCVGPCSNTLEAVILR